MEDRNRLWQRLSRSCFTRFDSCFGPNLAWIDQKKKKLKEDPLHHSSKKVEDDRGGRGDGESRGSGG